MKIACIAWGSLVWEPKNLIIKDKEWKSDGPLLPVEFGRQSADGRITLVIVPGRKDIKTLWNTMATNDLSLTIESLRVREKIPPKNINASIGVLETNSLPQNEEEIKIIDWLKHKNLNAAIWTKLSPKFNGEVGLMPTVEQVCNYLNNLSGETKDIAEEYIRKTPVQINTAYRSEIESKFNWSPL